MCIDDSVFPENGHDACFTVKRVLHCIKVRKEGDCLFSDVFGEGIAFFMILKILTGIFGGVERVMPFGHPLVLGSGAGLSEKVVNPWQKRVQFTNSFVDAFVSAGIRQDEPCSEHPGDV